MNTMTIQSAQNDLIHQILEIQDMDVLDRVKRLLLRIKVEKPVAVEMATDACVAKSKEEVLTDWTEVCQTIKLAREGKIEGRPIEEVLNEL